MPNLQNFKGSSFCRSLGRSLGPKLRPNQDSVDLCGFVLFSSFPRFPIFTSVEDTSDWKGKRVGELFCPEQVQTMAVKAREP